MTDERIKEIMENRFSLDFQEIVPLCERALGEALSTHQEALHFCHNNTPEVVARQMARDMARSQELKAERDALALQVKAMARDTDLKLDLQWKAAKAVEAERDDLAERLVKMSREAATLRDRLASMSQGDK
jgi:hypothetical protein